MFHSAARRRALRHHESHCVHRQAPNHDAVSSDDDRKWLSDFLAGSWFGVMAPAGTPPGIVRVLSPKLAEVASSSQFLDPLAKLGSENTLELGDEFAKSLETERALWKTIAKEANVQLTP